MASGISRTYSGAIVGTGAEITVSQVGFRPKMVFLYNPTDGSFAFHIAGMTDAHMAKQKAGTTTAVSSDGITIIDDGFKLGTDSDLNVSNEQVFFMAIE